MFSYRRIKKQLLKRKEMLEKKMKSDMETAAELGSVSDIASGELSAYDNHPAESATQLYEREKDLAFSKRMHDEWNDINDALAKMEKGTYGIDEITGKKIPIARMKALPTARTAVENAPPKHSRKERPVEESLIADSGRTGFSALNQSGFDEQNAFDLVSEYNDQEMIYEDTPYSDDEEGIGFVEVVEAIAATDIDGYSGDERVRFLRNQYYDQWMDGIDESDPAEH
ncbi:hypothetical protein OYT88_01085 [Sporolactobacillus sp. CQH2019]|uniref:hypothetical protein n=1 Tax=Sporolactobacillus sp. CQH2019 TaxID=3023512 RepID=UPI0023682B7F|nr:hypothetical protein [Sporolactobacillus sp. CQH2019]MDD9147141.1 hypothetical protein [Sporolactobacillus sp. CQH2019]